jgi:hypothetical protein
MANFKDLPSQRDAELRVAEERLAALRAEKGETLMTNRLGNALANAKEAVTEATGPERDLAERKLLALEMLAQGGSDPVWHGLQVNYCPATGDFTYFAVLRSADDWDISRAEVLALLAGKGEKG